RARTVARSRERAPPSSRSPPMTMPPRRSEQRCPRLTSTAELPPASASAASIRRAPGSWSPDARLEPPGPPALLAGLRRLRARALQLRARRAVPRLRRAARGPSPPAPARRRGPAQALPRAARQDRPARLVGSLEVPRARPSRSGRGGRRHAPGGEHAAPFARVGLALRRRRESLPEARRAQPDRLVQGPGNDRPDDAGSARPPPRRPAP